jgi:hypothetical protein
MFVFLGIPSILGWIYRTYLNHRQFMRVVQIKADLNTKLLDRIGSDPQAIEFFKNNVQQQLLEIKAEPTMPSAYTRMLTSVQFSAVLLSAGVAFLWLRRFMYGDDQTGFLFLGTIGVALGVGALLSAGAAFAVARLWQNSNDAAQESR